MRSLHSSAPLFVAALVLTGCDDSNPAVDAAATDAASVDATLPLDAAALDAAALDATALDATALDAAALDAASAPDGFVDPCAVVGAPIEVGSDITTDTTWTCNHVYRLTTPVLVRRADGASPDSPRPVLTIEAGTRIEGVVPSASSLPGALVVTTSGQLEAEGTAARPIVFTSSATAGTRLPGDWGGVVLLGLAPVTSTTGTGTLEGLPASYGTHRSYGGGTSADATWSCGTLRYARIEFAGYALTAGNELNGLTLGGCGTNTTVDHVQVHMGSDDGVEVFGGTVDLSHLLVTAAFDDSLDWDDGWSGRVQFFAAVQYPTQLTRSGATTAETPADRGIEADGGASGTPVSSPRLFNVTLVGDATSGIGVMLRERTEGLLSNLILTNFATTAIDVQTAESASAAQAEPPRLGVRHAIFDTLTTWTSTPGTDGLNEASFFAESRFENRTVAPALEAPRDLTAPNLRPTAASPALVGAETPSEAAGETRPSFFDPSAVFLGAVSPTGADWTAGWTAYPAS